MTAAPKPPSGQEGFFWKTKTLEEMSGAEWKAVRWLRPLLPGKAGDEDTGKIYFTHVSCKLLDAGMCGCKDYAIAPPRFGLRAADAGEVRTLNWLPPSCGYKLVAEGRDSIGGTR